MVDCESSGPPVPSEFSKDDAIVNVDTASADENSENVEDGMRMMIKVEEEPTEHESQSEQREIRSLSIPMSQKKTLW